MLSIKCRRPLQQRRNRIVDRVSVRLDLLVLEIGKIERATISGTLRAHSGHTYAVESRTSSKFTAREPIHRLAGCSASTVLSKPLLFFVGRIFQSRLRNHAGKIYSSCTQLPIPFTGYNTCLLPHILNPCQSVPLLLVSPPTYARFVYRAALPY